MSPPLNPWDSPKPKSLEQPGIRVALRHFVCVHKRCHNGADFPYTLLPDKPDSVPYYEILGKGPPPADVPGSPGDIYVDTVGNCPIIYVRDLQSWGAWNEPPGPDGTAKEVLVPPHPILSDRFFWMSQSIFIPTWLTGGTIGSLGIIPGSTMFDPTQEISTISKYTRAARTARPSCTSSNSDTTQEISQPISKRRKLQHLQVSPPVAPKIEQLEGQNDLDGDGSDVGFVIIEGCQNNKRQGSDAIMSAKDNLDIALSDFIMEKDNDRRAADEAEAKLRANLKDAEDELQREKSSTEDKIAAKTLALSEKCMEEVKKREAVEIQLKNASIQIQTLKYSLETSQAIVADTGRQLKEVSDKSAATEAHLSRLQKKLRKLANDESMTFY